MPLVAGAVSSSAIYVVANGRRVGVHTGMKGAY